MKKGDTVRVVTPVIEGKVLERRFTPDDKVEFLVEWSEGGEALRRWFDEHQIEAVASAESPQESAT